MFIYVNIIDHTRQPLGGAKFQSYLELGSKFKALSQINNKFSLTQMHCYV